MNDPRMPSAAQLAERILDDLGVPDRDETVDGFLDGAPDAPVAGIVVTMMATLPVLRQAGAVGPALVITHEPLYFDHTNSLVDQLQDDPVYRAKHALIAGAGLAVWHLHDHLHDHRPDLIDLGTVRALGWPVPTPASPVPFVADIPATRLDALARQVGAALGAGVPRFIGDPAQQVRRVGLDLGFRGGERNRAMLQRPDVDALLIGEAHEWETGEYVADAVAAGAPKGLIVAGHIPSEQQGMVELTRRIQGLGLGVPVTFVPARDPYQVA